MYFFSNSPVKWRLTKVVCGSVLANVLEEIMKRRSLEPEHEIVPAHDSRLGAVGRTLCSDRKQDWGSFAGPQTFPVPPSPTSTSLKVGGTCAPDASAILSKYDFVNLILCLM